MRTKASEGYTDLDLSQTPLPGHLPLRNEPCWHCSNLLVSYGGSVARPPFIYYQVVINGFTRKLHRKCVESIGFKVRK